MAFNMFKIFTWLLVISIEIAVFLLFQKTLSVTNWRIFSGNFETNTSKLDNEETTATPNAINTKVLATSVTSAPVTERENISTRAAVPETPMPILFEKNFSKLPVWDFEDVYNQDAAPANTRCQQSLRNSKDQNFKKAFLPNIRLFLHKDNINMSEWNRLSHFNNPFGFMGYSYNDVMSAVKLIPEPKEPLLSPKPGGDGCIRCAVVGTAGILNGSKMGKEIDAHDYVFRMNGAVTKGYEDDVGNKTSVYVHTSYSIIVSLRQYKKYGFESAPHDEGIKYVMIAEGMRAYQWLQGLLRGERVELGMHKNRRPQTYYMGQYNESRFYVLHQDFLRYVRNRFLKSPNLNKNFWALVRPTCGAVALFLALHTCDIVDAYGFMTRDYAKYSIYYFHHDKTRVIFHLNHDYNLEMKTWEKLHKSKIMRLYQRNEKKSHQKT
ncbi:alpha-N-acetylgalactosaminide alpha-2,6-sialyltransferase 1-like [Festucalex cinctus]